MATIPSFETILLQCHQSLCGTQYSTKKKRAFATGQASMDTQLTMTDDILSAIFTALKLENIDEFALEDAKQNIMKMADAYRTVTLNTWTVEVDSRQIIWDMLGYFFTPSIAKIIAHWNLPEPLDKDMPLGRFWYLPEPTEGNTSSLKMPVTQVVDWLLDLLDMPMEDFASERTTMLDEKEDSVSDGMIRSLYKWKKGTLPKLDSIDLYFPDKMEIKYRGVLQLEGIIDQEDRFKAVIEFVENRGLTPEALRMEISIGDPDRIKRIIAGETDAEQRAEFVEKLANRYAAPLPSTIRHRLRIARAVQDGYSRLLKFLCPKVKADCADPEVNKLVQVFALFKLVYNLTTDAAVKNWHMEEQVESEWFEKQLRKALIDPELFLSILPSQRERASLETGRVLSHRFKKRVSNGGLPDLLPAEAELSVAKYFDNFAKTQTERQEGQNRFDTLNRRLLSGNIDEALAGEDRFDVLFDTLKKPDWSFETHDRLFKKIVSLDLAPWQRMEAVLFRIETLIENDASSKLIEFLIEKSKMLPGYEIWKGPFLYNEGLHRIKCNDFDGAAKCFREAAKDCLTRNYGSLRGEIAKDLFALEVANQKLITANHEKHYRDMLNFYPLQPEEFMGFEDMGVHVYEYFWAELYKPYPGVSVLKPALGDDIEKLLSPILKYLRQGDTQGLERWLKKNKNSLKKPLRHIRGGTVLIGLIIFWDTIEKQIGQLPYLMQLQLPRLFRDTISTVSKEAPQVLTIADFKGQTPLMLVAERGDAKLVEAMIAAGADPAAQDYQGKTALHTSIVRGHKSVIDALMKHEDCATKETVLGETPAHSAALAGDVETLEKLLLISPALATAQSIYGSPLERAEAFLEPDRRKQFRQLAKQNSAKMADEHEIRACIDILRSVTGQASSDFCKVDRRAS